MAHGMLHADGGPDHPNGQGAASAPKSLADTARRFVGHLAARLPGLDSGAAQRNAWEAVCADLQRRQQWEGLVDFTRAGARRRSDS